MGSFRLKCQELSELLDRTGPHSSAARDALALATRSAVAAVCHSKAPQGTRRRGCICTLVWMTATVEVEEVRGSAAGLA